MKDDALLDWFHRRDHRGARNRGALRRVWHVAVDVMDEADRAQAREEEFRADAEAERRRHSQAHALKPTGYCHWCAEAVRGGLLFCDKDCAIDFEADQARKRREGLA